MSQHSHLTPAQQHVLALLAAGATAASAARVIGVHRNTVGNWLRTPDFREALAQARVAQAEAWRAQAAGLASQAFDAIRALITDPKATPETRLEAALAVRSQFRQPPPPNRPGRNDPCPCGSGRKYKRCCLASR